MEHKVEVLRILGRWSKKNKPYRYYQVRFELSIDGRSMIVDRDIHWRPSGISFTHHLHFHNPLIKKSKDYKDIRYSCVVAIGSWVRNNQEEYKRVRQIHIEAEDGT